MMKNRLLGALLFAALVSPALMAQDNQVKKGRFGLTFPGLGAIWQVNRNVALIEGIGFTHNWTSASGFSDTNSGNNLSINSGVRFYIQEWKGLRFYLSPKYMYGRGTSESSSGNSTVRRVSNSHAASGSWGIQYALSGWLSLFGDIGAIYSRIGSSSSSTFTGDVHSNTIGTTGSWGLIFYVK